MTDADGDPPTPDATPEPARKHKPGAETLFRDAQEARIASAEGRAKEAEEDKDKATAETIAAWKWTGLAWRNAFIGSWSVVGILVAFVLGVNYLDLDVPLIGHLKLSKGAEPERAAPGVEKVNAAEEVLDEQPALSPEEP